MLKTQIGSKISQLAPEWRSIEDVLTGDFFGVLDYLPRRPYLRDFFAWVSRLNESTDSPCLTNVDWAKVEILFWPKAPEADDHTEPDLVIVSNRWVVVVEAKLNSTFGWRQPQREFAMGIALAGARGLPATAVYYLVIARSRLNVEKTYAPPRSPPKRELVSRTLHLPWFQAVSLAESWLTSGVGGQEVAAGHARMLEDLVAAMRRRRAIAFAGFSFGRLEHVPLQSAPVFCRPMFEGFQAGAKTVITRAGASVFLSRFAGFLCRVRRVARPAGRMLTPARFDGFLSRAPRVLRLSAPLLGASRFAGFLQMAPSCRESTTLLL